MNQTNSKELVLTALEARNIQAELFEILAHVADLTEVKRNALADNAVIKIDVNGGAF